MSLLDTKSKNLDIKINKTWSASTANDMCQQDVSSWIGFLISVVYCRSVILTPNPMNIIPPNGEIFTPRFLDFAPRIN